MRLPIPLLAAFGLCACSNSVSLQFHNASDAVQGLKGSLRQALDGHAPDAFAMKLVAVYLAADVDPTTQNNVGMTEMIYLNPACGEDISHCELAPGTNPLDGSPYTHFVTDYFDFAADSSTVNAAINAQGRVVAAGTYRYARMEFCKGNTSNTPNIRWGTEGVTQDYASAMCGVTSAPFAVPLELSGSGEVVVTLAYDLSATVSDVGSDGRVTGMDCLTTGTGEHCFTPPPFVPSAALVH